MDQQSTAPVHLAACQSYQITWHLQCRQVQYNQQDLPLLGPFTGATVSSYICMVRDNVIVTQRSKAPTTKQMVSLQPLKIQVLSCVCERGNSQSRDNFLHIPHLSSSLFIASKTLFKSMGRHQRVLQKHIILKCKDQDLGREVGEFCTAHVRHPQIQRFVLGPDDALWKQSGTR